jgi:hypothetical protein
MVFLARPAVRAAHAKVSARGFDPSTQQGSIRSERPGFVIPLLEQIDQIELKLNGRSENGTVKHV